MARPKKKYIVTHSNSFTTYLDKALKEKGKTWENLITDLSFSTSAIRNWLSGHRYPSLDSIKKIADYLSINDPKLLIQGCEKMNLKFGAESVDLILLDIIEKEKIPLNYFWKDDRLSGNTVKNTFQRGRKPSLKILKIFVELLQKKKVKGIQTPLDLIEFKSSPNHKK